MSSDDDDDDDYFDFDDARDAVDDASDVLALYRDGDAAEAIELFNQHSWRGGPDREFGYLINEADDLLREGNVDDAMHRLRLAAEPKWSSVRACQEQYDAAMEETRRAREASV